jgi:HD-GYP domain-containing protein (c-di-GMP phosphodiesterase class II)
MQAEHCIPAAPPSVLRSLNQLAHRLDRSLTTLGDGSNAEAELRAIAEGVVDAVGQAPDVALASICLNQISGPYAVRHCVEAAIVCCVMARAMDRARPDIVQVAAAALTMNAGMVRISEVFQLRDQALSDEERSAVHRHPAESADLLRRAGIVDEDWIRFVLMHHEIDNGSGYPSGLDAQDIPDGARLVGMADRYCALVSARNYRRSMLPPVAARKLIAECADGRMAALFLQEIGQHPPGTLVRLRYGELGVVSSRGHVHALRDHAGQPLNPPLLRSTGDPGHAIDAALHEDDAGLRFSMRDVWGEQAAV